MKLAKTKTYRLSGGMHAQDGKRFHKGDLITTDRDLSKLNFPGSRRFVEVEDVAENKPADQVRFSKAELDQLSVQGLKDLAADEEIDVTGASTKAALIERILS